MKTLLAVACMTLLSAPSFADDFIAQENIRCCKNGESDIALAQGRTARRAMQAAEDGALKNAERCAMNSCETDANGPCEIISSRVTADASRVGYDVYRATACAYARKI